MAASWLSSFFFSVAYVAVGAAFVLLFFLYLQVRRLKRTPAKRPVEEFTNMLMLLQTLREVIFQQKSLARAFNKNVEEKIRLIHDIIKRTLEEQQRLREAQRDLEARLAEWKRALANAPALSGEPPAPSAETAAPSGPANAGRGEPFVEAPLHVLAEPVESGADTESADDWVGLDFTADEPDSAAAPGEAPKAPEDPEAARKAFRALLNLDQASPAETRTNRRLANVGTDPGNGRDRTAALRARIYQYADAGMSIPQIARELGIGKGEVRLFMSLREKK